MDKNKILKENFIYYKDADITDFEALSYEENKYFFDTESCADMPDEIVEKFNLTEVEFSTLPEFQTLKEGSLLHTMKKNKTLKAKVYVWQFGCNTTDKVYWGNTIAEFIEFVQKIDAHRVKEGHAITPFDIYVHNLAWDIEFFKYYFKANDMEQIRAGHTTNERKKSYKKQNSFDITETDGAVHNARIQLNKVKVGRKSVMTTLVFADSFKITPLSLKKISTDLIEVDDIYVKDGEVYKYDLIRNENNYVPTEVEAWYIYCDIYLLKEWYNQFVIPNYIKNGINPFTISQIAFQSILDISFEADKKAGKYNHLRDKKGNISSRAIYEEHYALKIIEQNPAHAEYIRLSYKGGVSTVGQKYKEIAEDDNAVITGTSCDITSSYPDKCVNYPLPFGVPTAIKEGKYEDFEYNNKKYDFHFITVGFDGWHSRTKDNQFGLPVKVLGLDDDQKKALKWTPNEIYPSNVVKGVYVGTNRISVKNTKRAEKIDKLPYKYIITLTHHEYECWNRMFKFIRYENNKRVEGVHFIDYISFQSEIGFMAEGIKHYFRMKDEGDKEGNTAKTYNSKILINSFYGKNCSKRERQQRFYDFNKDIISFASVTEENRNEWLDDKLYAVQYGAAVTSWGRIQLMETVNKLGADKFVYADTDSLKIEGIGKEELIAKFNEMKNEYNFECVSHKLSTCKAEKELGSWDWEFDFKNFKAIGQKKYMYQLEEGQAFKCKCAGLPEQIRKTITKKEQFGIGKTFSKNAKTKVIGGYLLLSNDYTITDLTRL